MAMIVEGEVSVNASAEEVWAILGDVEHWNEWTPSIKSILLLDPKPLHLGSTALIEQPRLPRAKWQVTKIEPGRGFDWVSKNIGSLTIGEHWITPDPKGGVKVVLRVRQTGWMAAIFRPWIEKLTREYVAIEAEGLKRRCEQSSSNLLARLA